VRSLKVKLEHFEGECEQLRKSQKEDAQEQQLEAQLKTARNKLKKVEKLLKVSLEALRKISKEVVQSHQQSMSRKTSAF